VRMLREAGDRLVRLVAGFARHEGGGVAVHVALSLPLLLGALGMAVDIGLAAVTRQSTQTQADAGAMAAALELAQTTGTAAMKAAAQIAAEANGFGASGGDLIATRSPPASGVFAGDTAAVEVVITHPQRLTFVGFVGGERDITITARAVARSRPMDACVWGLEDTGTAIEVGGTAEVRLGCGVYARSRSGKAIDQNGNSCLTATSVLTTGGSSGTCVKPAARTGAPRLDDPLAALPVPTEGTACTSPSKREINADAHLAPGVYCGGIQVSGGAKVTFAPGVYVIKGGDLGASGNSTLTGQGVTFYLTQDSGSFASLDFTSTTLDLSAPTSGANQGVLFFQDRDAPAKLENKIVGNTVVNLTGAIYLPATELKIAGGSGSNAAKAFVVARTVRFTGNSEVLIGSPAPALPPGLITATLVE